MEREIKSAPIWKCCFQPLPFTFCLNRARLCYFAPLEKVGIGHSTTVWLGVSFHNHENFLKRSFLEKTETTRNFQRDIWVSDLMQLSLLG